MSKGSGKGQAFERKICVALSMWVTRGRDRDCFWRTAMSGGRATVLHPKGVRIRQVGDVGAIAPEGHEFCNQWFVDCKHVKQIRLASFLFNDRGPLARYWRKIKQQAEQHERSPMLIVRENNGPILVLTPSGAMSARDEVLKVPARDCEIYRFDKLTRYPYKILPKERAARR